MENLSERTIDDMELLSAKECYEMSMNNKKMIERKCVMDAIEEAVQKGEFEICVSPVDEALKQELTDKGYKIKEDVYMDYLTMIVSWKF